MNNNTPTPNRIINKRDIILFIVVICIAISGFVILNLIKESGGTVTVSVDGKITDSYPLSKDQTIIINPEDQTIIIDPDEENPKNQINQYKNYNKLVIKNGTAEIVEADCPDKLCVKQRTISSTNETIVCLPHKVIVKIEGGKEADIDGVLQ